MKMKLNEEAMKSCTGSSNNNNGGTTGAGGRHGGGLRDNYTASTRGHIGDSTDEKYKEINTRLRRLLAEERKALQSVRLNYSTELRSRTEMEMLLRQCVDDVRKEISLRTFNTSSKVGSRPSSSGASMALGPATSSFTQGDRERALELLLSQERVISLVYAKTFPTNQSNKSKSLGATLDMSSGGQSGSSDITGRADNDILQAISLGLSSSAIALFKSRDSDECNLDLPISEGGGGPLIVAALLNCSEIEEHADSNKLPAISRHERE